jgi:SAM-dependent methyltransferase
VDAITALCPGCGSHKAAQGEPYQNKGPHRHSLFENAALLRCQDCRTGWVKNSPSSETLRKYYESTYSPARISWVEGDRWPPPWDNRSASLILLGRLFGTFKEGDMFVDVGPGNGAALAISQWLLPRPKLTCVEYNERSIAYFKRHIPGIEVTQSLGSLRDGSVSLLYSSHSLEHFRPDDVLDSLRDAFKALKFGGVFVLEVPYGDRAHPRHVPHLLFFTPTGIRKLLERAGFYVPLTLVAEGRTKVATARVRKIFSHGAPSVLAQKLEVLNMGDLVPTDKIWRGTALKCVAIKSATA